MKDYIIWFGWSVVCVFVGYFWAMKAFEVGLFKQKGEPCPDVKVVVRSCHITIPLFGRAGVTIV